MDLRGVGLVARIVLCEVDAADVAPRNPGALVLLH